jgi:biofilm PGA synthesis N-glycosyltransferase PgaC
VDLASFLHSVQLTVTYKVALVFFAAYPIVTGILWMTTTFFFRARWERDRREPPPPLEAFPKVSILISAHNEERVLGQAIEACRAIDYPDYEIVVVDDGSSDRTLAEIQRFMDDSRVRVIHKVQNEGKALALNDALPCLNGEIVLIMDADAEPEPNILRHLVPHFTSARVAAVTGNPRVKNVVNFLTRLQFMEFTSIVSLLRRSQRIWGRVVTVSGVVCAFRRAALVDVNGFSPDMSTEDIELTWRLQKNFWDVRYEPRALVWMTVPETIRTHFRQRLRWARGLMQVLRRHADVVLHWKYRRMWPIFTEATLSTLWALDFVVLTSLWSVSYAAGVPPIGAHPIPNFWGMTIATICMLQLLEGALMDRPYDPQTPRYYAYAVYYPIIYWAILQLATFLSLHHLFRRRSRQPVRWATKRQK